MKKQAKARFKVGDKIICYEGDEPKKVIEVRATTSYVYLVEEYEGQRTLLGEEYISCKYVPKKAKKKAKK
jgi:hypothetical protein